MQPRNFAERDRGRLILQVGMVLVAATLLLVGACAGDAPGPNRVSPRDGGAGGPARYGGEHAGGTATGDTAEGAAFARWVLEQDPRREYLTDAVVRDDRVLGVRVQPNISRGDLQDLLGSLAEGMAREFPNRPITVNAFYQSGDKLAEAHYDPRTGDVTFR